MIDHVMKGTDVVISVAAINAPSTFAELTSIFDRPATPRPVIVVGNKIDLDRDD